MQLNEEGTAILKDLSENKYVKSENSKADEETEEELLDLYLIDYYPTDFLQFYYEWFMFDTNKPCATMTYVFLNLTFKRAAN